jgi:hypothetical protein
MARTSDELVEEMAAAFAAAVAAGIEREIILADFIGTSILDLAQVALCRAQDRFIIGRHERLYGALGPAVPAGAR